MALSPPDHPRRLVLGSIVTFNVNDDWQANLQTFTANQDATTLILHGGRLTDGNVFRSLKDDLPQITTLGLNQVRVRFCLL